MKIEQNIPYTCPNAASLTELIPTQQARIAALQERAGSPADTNPAQRIKEMDTREDISILAGDIVRECRGCNAAGIFLQGVVECPSQKLAVSIIATAALADCPQRG
jgi:hypothetical protein